MKQYTFVVKVHDESGRNSKAVTLDAGNATEALQKAGDNYPHLIEYYNETGLVTIRRVCEA